MRALRLQYDPVRITIKEEIFLGKLLVSVSYDGIFIGTIAPEGRCWRDDHGCWRLTRERAIRAVLRHCHYHMTPAQYPAFVQREGGHL
ncbi:MAG: hypothetical protein H0X24_00780 [Ktedonobacterales bacterium]|nr:hypothetical protein [Ktedonobacterales bacterium]